ncbi:hypothetical protein JYU34_020091 [Plutella xylostella]|uniref:Uncharacterized protein n=1 Tax=Plutella xylostella TaxID=51655 RepID=A0ABQ7PVX2_PLUXY|nr:hypothetical protein JYU34_020091 [Plutella xylostella]
MFLGPSKAAGAASRVLLVREPSSARARVVAPAPEDVATLKFSTKKLVVARPRLKKVLVSAFPGSFGFSAATCT